MSMKLMGMMNVIKEVKKFVLEEVVVVKGNCDCNGENGCK